MFDSHGTKFQQFVHCKFREIVVRTLIIVSPDHKNRFLVVNKYGKVGIYDATERLTLVNAYVLDMTQGQVVEFKVKSGQRTRVLPKCAQTHLVVDAVWARDLASVFFLTNKGILQGYDTGTIELQPYGVNLSAEKTVAGQRSSIQVKSLNHVETHRIQSLRPFPTCMEYFEGDSVHWKEPLILIGSSDGTVTIFRIPDKKNVFGRPKVKNEVQSIKIENLLALGLVTVYDAHDGPITDLRFLPERNAVVTSCKNVQDSLVFYDLRQILNPLKISVPMGLSCLAHCETLQILATGSDDGTVRLFNDLVPSKPIAELRGHTGPIKSLEFYHAPFTFPDPMLLSFSEDVEFRVWDTTKLTCLESFYVSFPIKSGILCKSPGFARRAILVYDTPIPSTVDTTNNCEKSGTDFVLLLYCNSFAEVHIIPDDSYWPFNFDQLFANFQDIKVKVQKKTENQTKRYKTLPESDRAAIEVRVEAYVDELMTFKGQVDAVVGSNQQALSTVLAKMSRTVRKDRLRWIQEGGAFKALDTVTLDPIVFLEKDLPVTDTMVEAGLTSVTSPEDLLTPIALKFFSTENMSKIGNIEGSLARIHYKQVLDGRSGGSSNLLGRHLRNAY